MNMRAAEATVSSAPKAMKIFPISEVSSQVELSLLAGAAAAALTVLFEAIATVCEGVAASCKARSTSLSWSGAITWLVWLSAGACASAGLASAGLSALAIRIALARAVIAPALSDGASASSALALATVGATVAGTSPLASATSLSAAFVLADDFSAVRLYLRCAYRFQWREPCLADLVTATASAFEVAASVAAVVQDTPAKHTKSPVATIKAERPLALIFIGNLPSCPIPARKKTLLRVHSGAEKGNLRATTGESRARSSTAFAQFAGWRIRRVIDATDASQADRCYEPCRRTLPSRFPARGTAITTS